MHSNAEFLLKKKVPKLKNIEVYWRLMRNHPGGYKTTITLVEGSKHTETNDQSQE